MREEKNGSKPNPEESSKSACKRGNLDQSSHEPENSCKPKLFQPAKPSTTSAWNSMNQVSLPIRPTGSNESETTDATGKNGREVRVRLGEIFPLLQDAIGSQRQWLDDFADEEIAISVDLHDVLEAYRNFWSDAA